MQKSVIIHGGITAASAACGWIVAALVFPASPASRKSQSPVGAQPILAASLIQIASGSTAAGRFQLLVSAPADAVPAIVGGLDPMRDLSLMRVLLRRLAESNPHRAMEVMAALDLAEEQIFPDSLEQVATIRPRDFLMNAILSVWAASDANASDVWIRENVRPPIKLDLETIKVLAEANPLRTAKTLLAVSRPHVQAQLMEAVFAPLLRQSGGPTECQAIALEISHRTPASMAMEAQLPSALLKNSTSEATAALNALSPDLQTGSAIGLARTMLGRDSGSVVELAAAIENPKARDSYLETTFSQMTHYERAALTDQIGLISDPDVRRRVQKLPE